MKVYFPVTAVVEFFRSGFRMPVFAISLGMALTMPAAAESNTPEAQPDLTGLSIEELLSVEVYSASKFPQKTIDAPAAVTIITAADIKTYGYRTLADALKSVRDYEVGMSAEQLGRLFQPLFTTKARGIGLGLVVVNLSQANGGRVEVQSEPGKGTTFAVTLPCAGQKGEAS